MEKTKVAPTPKREKLRSCSRCMYLDRDTTDYKFPFIGICRWGPKQLSQQLVPNPNGAHLPPVTANMLQYPGMSGDDWCYQFKEQEKVLDS
jgi:hypothetical protein